MSIDSIGRSSAQMSMPTGVGTELQTTQTQGSAGLSQAAMATILKEMQELTTGTDKPGAKAPTGAPALSQPIMNFSAEDSALILQSMQNKLTESQISTAKEGIKLDQEQKQRLHEEALKKIDEIAKKLAESNKFGVFGKVFSIAGQSRHRGGVHRRMRRGGRHPCGDGWRRNACRRGPVGHFGHQPCVGDGGPGQRHQPGCGRTRVFPG